MSDEQVNLFTPAYSFLAFPDSGRRVLDCASLGTYDEMNWRLHSLSPTMHILV